MRNRALLVAVPLTYLLYFVCVRGSFFFFDDFFWFHEADKPFGIAYLRRGNYGHFAPVTRTAYVVYHGLFGLEWRPASLLLPALVVVLVVSVYVLARELGANETFATLAGGVVALSPVTLHLSQWWGGSIHNVGGLLGTTWVAIEFLRWQRTGSRWHYAGSLGAFAAALLVQERPVVVLAALGLFALYPPSKAWARQPLRTLRAIVPYLVIGAGYAVFFTTQYPTDAAPLPSVGLVVRFLRRAAAESGVLGIGLQPDRLGSWTGPVGATVVLLAGWLAVRQFRKPEVRMPVLLIVGMWLANLGLVAYGRLGLYGINVAGDLQYYIDALVWFAAPLGAILSRPTARRPSLLLPAGMLVAFIVTWPSILAHDSWAYFGRNAGAYMRPVGRGVQVLRGVNQPVELLPQGTPAAVFPAWVPLDQPQVLRLFSPPPVSTPGAPLKFTFDDRGHLRQVQPLYTDVLDFTARRRPALTVNGERDLSVGTRGVCVAARGPTTLQVGLDERRVAGATLLEIDYTSDAAYPIGYSTAGGSGDARQSPVFNGGFGTQQLLLPYNPAAGARLLSITGPPGGATTCLLRVAFLFPVAQPSAGVALACEQLGPNGQRRASVGCGGLWYQPTASGPGKTSVGVPACAFAYLGDQLGWPPSWSERC